MPTVLTHAPLPAPISNPIALVGIAGKANPDLTATITGYVHGENAGTANVTGTPGLSTTAGSSSTVAAGPYTITCMVDGMAAANYSFTPVAGKLVVVNIAHTGVNFHSPGTAPGIKVEFSYPVGSLSSLKWTPTLPTGWTLAAASNATTTAAYTLTGNGVVVPIGDLGANPVTFYIYANVPGNQTSIVTFTNASVDLTFTPGSGSAISATSVAMADNAECWRFHSADYGRRVSGRTVAGGSDWVIDATEMNRVLAYWRNTGGNYYLNSSGLDGYSVVAGTDPASALHSADYEGTYGVIDAAEAARVVGYWRAGGYQVNASSIDGYADNAPPQLHPLMVGSLASSAPSATLTQTGPAQYDANGTVVVNATLTYSGRLLALSWTPTLPAGWQIVAVSGQGNPELQRGEVLFTSTDAELPNPLTFTYTVQVPLSARGTVTLDSVAKPMLQGVVNTLVVPTSQSLVMTVKDTGHSGLPDGWQMHYFGHLGVDSLADADGDGMNNLDEALAGTNPNDATSRLIITDFDATNGKMVLRWQSAADRTYTILGAAAPTGPFTPLATGIPSTPPENTTEVEMGGNQFLRVQAE